MTKIKIIDETVAYYQINEKAINSDEGTCVYLTETGDKCAVGRCLRPKVCNFLINSSESLSDMFENIESYEQKSLNLDKMLKKKYQGHSIGFWESLQRLHDQEYYWNNRELSDKGVAYVNELKQLYGKN